MTNSLTLLDKIKFILNKGIYDDGDLTEDVIDDSLDVLKKAAEKIPSFLLQEILAARDSNMALTALAILFASAPNTFLSNVKNDCLDVLIKKTPDELLHFIEMLKNKMFGRGFGSRPQKIIRMVLESWMSEDLENYIREYKYDVIDLIKLAHPRFNNYRGDLVKMLLNNEL